MPQWVAGFCRIMREENDLQNKNSMLDYLISLFEDVQDFSCRMELCRMEQGEVKNYPDTEKIDRIWRTNVNVTLLHLLLPKRLKSKIKRLVNPCHVPIIIRVLVHSIEPMTQKA